jgi:glutathione S-transferase
VQRRELGLDALGMLEAHLQDASFFVADRYSIADISLYAYTHTAPDAGFELADYPAVAAWLRRVETQPGFMNDLEPYPANARAGAGSSVYG